MKILVFSPVTCSHGQGGLERHLAVLAEKLVERGHMVTVIASRHPEGIEEKFISGVKYHYLKNTVPSLWSQDYFIESTKLARKTEADVIWSQSIAGLGWVNFNKKSNVQAVPFVTYVHGHFLDMVLCYLRFSLTKSKVGGPFQGDENLRYGYFLNRFLHDYVDAQRILSYSDAIISVSIGTLKTLKCAHFLTSKKFFVVYNGVDSDIFKPDINTNESMRLRLGLSGNKKVILSVGRLTMSKGVQYLIEAFEILLKAGIEATLIIVGDGPCRSDLEAFTRMNNLEGKVIFAGRVEYNELPRFYNLCDFLVLPSTSFEAFPLVSIEAMACGKPVIASKVGGIVEQIDHMHNGILVLPGDILSMCEEMLLLMRDRPELASCLGRNARNTVLKKFDANTMARKVEDIFHKLISEKEI